MQTDRCAYVFLSDRNRREIRLTYGELDQRVRIVAGFLQKRTTRRARVVLLFPHGPEYVIAFLACLYAGRIAVPLYPPRPNQKQFRALEVLGNCNPELALTEAATHAMIDAFRLPDSHFSGIPLVASDRLPAHHADHWRVSEFEKEDLAFLQYTSGSTGQPKGSMISHGNLVTNLAEMDAAGGFTRREVGVSWLPLYHDMGLIGTVLLALYRGFLSVHMPPLAFIQDPLLWLEVISRFRGTLCGGPNFAFELVLQRLKPERASKLDLDCWKCAFNGAEPVRWETLQRFSETFAPRGFRLESFYPCYGMAEATLMISGGRKPGNRPIVQLDEHGQERTGCGQVREGFEIRFVDPESRTALPEGKIGEIWVRGESVALGYWNRPEENERAFSAHMEPGGDGPFFRTGDLGFLARGELFVSGRLKDLIIICGRNHYPQDLELTAEACHPALSPNGSAAFSINLDGEEELVLVLEVERHHVRRLDSAEVVEVVEAVRSAVAEQHDLRVHAVALLRPGRLPKTSSGKVQRRVCRERFLKGELKLLAEQVLPREKHGDLVRMDRETLAATPRDARVSVVETYLLRLAASTLRVEAGSLNPERSLAGLGLDSLAVANLEHRLEMELGLRLSVEEFFQAQNFTHLATTVVNQFQAAKKSESQSSWGQDIAQTNTDKSLIGARPSCKYRQEGDWGQAILLSRNQEALWFLYRLAPESTAYHLSYALRFHGQAGKPVEREIIRRACELWLKRHPSLRSVFFEREGQPYQRVLDEQEPPFLVIDRTGWDLDRVRAHMSAFVRTPFDLERSPPLRLVWYDAKDQDPILLISVHHLAVDYWSLLHLLDELGIFCSRGAESLKTLPKVNYAQFVADQRNLLNSPRANEMRDFWQARLAGNLPVLELPRDRPRPRIQSFNGASIPFILDTDLGGDLVRFSTQMGVTLFTLLLSAFQCLLHRFSGQDDVLVGAPASGRNQARFREVIGYFVNPVVMRARFGRHIRFRDFLVHNKRQVLEALAFADLPFLQLIEWLQIERDPSRSPLFQAMFVFQNPHMLAGTAPWSVGLTDSRVNLGDLEVSSVSLPRDSALFDISLYMTTFEAQSEKKLGGTLEYNSDLFDEATAVRLLEGFKNVLFRVVKCPDELIATLPLLSKKQRERQLSEWNAREGRATADKNLCAWFQETAVRTPDAVVIVDRNTHLTFALLEGKAHTIGDRLRRNGAGGESLVGICTRRNPSMVAAVLAVHRTGSAYIPLDPNYPPDHAMRVLEHARLVVCERATRATLSASGKTLIQLDDSGAVFPERTLSHPVRISSSNLSHVIFTSGSTGLPKGVAVRHGAVAALLQWAAPLFGQDLDAILAGTSICFDLSVFELFCPLCLGGAMVLAENTMALTDLPARHRVRLLNTVPSVASQLLRNGSIPRGVRIANLAGEPLPRGLADGLQGLGFIRDVYNLYGPSEDTTYSTAQRLHPEDMGPPSIGTPINGTRGYVLDGLLQPVPVGVPGELFLGGLGLARGYYGRPDLTAAAFIPNPFSRAGAFLENRVYASGDLVRTRADGSLDFIGRRDHQIKLRGFRIEPGEIEAVLSTHPGVAGAVVLAHGQKNDRHLVAYIQQAPAMDSRGEEPQESPPNFLRQRLPFYMVPDTWLRLAELPRKPNGKIDREALARLPLPQRVSAAPYRAPRNSREARLAAIWAEVLDLRRVGIDDSFFELGGHSLAATRVVARVGQAFSTQIPVRFLFEAPTIAGMANLLTNHARGGNPEDEFDPIPTSGRSEESQKVFPLSFAQQRLWFLGRLERDGAAYHMAAALQLSGALDVAALESALESVRARHDALRTRFVLDGDHPMQVIDSYQKRPLPVVDISIGEGRTLGALSGVTETHARLPFDLAAGPVFRALLMRVDSREHRLLVAMHHIVSDGWSIDLFQRELAESYGARVSGQQPELPKLVLQYGDFAHWQRRSIDRPGMSQAIAYWREQLGGALPVPRYPMDGLLSESVVPRGDKVEMVLASETVQTLRGLAQERRATLFMTLLAAFQILLGRLTGERDVIVGVPSAGRLHPDLEPLIGCFLNTLALRSNLGDTTSFSDFLGQLRQAFLEAFSHESLPFEKLVELLQPNRDLVRHPLFDVMVNQVEPFGLGLAFPGLTWKLVEPAMPESKFFMTLYVEDKKDLVKLKLVYRADLFSAPRMHLLLEQFQTLLEQIAANPTAPLHSFSLVTPSNRAWLPDPDRAIEVADYPRLGHMFETWVARTPSQSALRRAGQSWSYAELSAAANGIADFLERASVPRGAVVAVSGARSFGMIAAVLAVPCAGRVLLTLDSRLPPKRRGFMLAEAGACLLLTAEREPSIEEPEIPTAFVNPDCGSVRSNQGFDLGEDAETLVHQEAAAYLFFTSGTSGFPKAVLGSHSGLSHFLTWQRETFGVGPQDRCSQLTGLSFDVVLRDIFLPLTSGATLCLPEESDTLQPARILAWLERERISLIHAVPSLVRFWLEDAPKSPPQWVPQFLFLAGEPLPDSLVARWRWRFGPGTRMVNLYGPTETTLAKCFYEVPHPPRPGVQPVGGTLPGAQAWVVNECGRPAGVGEPGEIVIRTPFRTLGYWREGRLSYRGFQPNPARRDPEDLIYYSGDKGRFLPDGALEILGRLDDQLKIRGIRIEPAEIESRLRMHPGLKEAAVVAKPSGGNELRLLAFVQIPRSGAQSEPPIVGADLAAYLRAYLPDILIPTRFVFLESLPLNANGKLDRQALAAMDLPATAPMSAGSEPRGEIEIRVATIWRELLDLDTLGLDDNFFEVGGHSLLLARVQARIQEGFKQDIPMLDLFRFSTVRTLAARLGGQEEVFSGKTGMAPRFPDRAEARASRQASRRTRTRGRREIREILGESE